MIIRIESTATFYILLLATKIQATPITTIKKATKPIANLRKALVLSLRNGTLSRKVLSDINIYTIDKKSARSTIEGII